MSTTNDEDEDVHYVDDTWTLYFHDPADANWNVNSYVRAVDLCSLEDLAAVQLALRGRTPAGMVFLMREHVFPCWDDNNNLEGGTLCLKVPMTAAEDTWNRLCVLMLTEALPRTGGAAELDPGIINGASISPKTSFCVIKVWVSQPVPASALRLPSDFGDVVFRSSRDSIRESQTCPRRHLRPSAPGPAARDTA